MYSEAVAFIATVVYSGEKPARARKIVRDRLFRYRVDGRIPSGTVIQADIFFRSVIRHFPDWHQLLRVQNLPGVERPFDQAGVNETARASDAVTAFVVPGDIARAQALIQALHKENQSLTKRVQELETLVKELGPYRHGCGWYCGSSGRNRLVRKNTCNIEAWDCCALSLAG